MDCKTRFALALAAGLVFFHPEVAEAQQRQCPAGTVAVGSTCEANERPVAAPASTVDYGTHPDVGLAVAGGVILGLGYGAQIVFGILGDNPILYIPVVGGFIHAPLNGTDGGIALGLSVSTAQTLGLIFFIWGLATQHPNEAPRASLEPELVPGPGEAGVGLRWRF